MVLPILGANTESAAYEISNSLRFNDDDSTYLSRTVGTPTNEKIYTVSVWVKRGNTGTNNTIIGSPPEGDRILVGDKFEFFTNGSASSYLRTNAVARDNASWYHVVVAYDVTQGTAANRVKYYVNGEQLTFDLSTTFPSQDDTNGKINKSGTTLEIGHGHNGYCDGYMADFNLVDGQALDPSYFGETNTNGVWVPKKYTGTYGNNGFFLEFQQTGTSANASGMGADTSGNTNHFAVNNLGADHVTTDTPTNNFATMDVHTAGSVQPVLREGNTQQYSHGSANSAAVAATIMPDAGKWYVELKLSSPSGGDYPFFGITDNRNLSQQDGSSAGDNGSKMAAGFEIDGQTNNQSNTFLGSITNTNTGWPSFSDEDIVQFALDLDNRKLWIGRNGTYINSGNPAAGSNEQLAWTLSTNVSVCMLGYDGGGGGGAGSLWNFGNPAYTVSSSNADANGHGNFEYSVPSGYFALCSKNLAEIS